MTNHRTLKALIPVAAGLLCVALLNVPSAQAAPRDKQVGTTTGTKTPTQTMYQRFAAENSPKIGNRSQFSQGGARAARAQSTSPSPKATTATRGRPQSLVFKPGRFIIKNLP